VKRRVLRSSSPRGRRRRRWRRGSRGGRRRLATAYRTARGLQMYVIHEPAAAVRPDDVDRDHLTAIGALELDTIRAQLIPSRDGHWSLDDAVAGMIEVLLNDGEALAQDVGVHGGGGGTTLGAPQLAHAFLIVGFHGDEKLGDRFVHRLRHWSAGARLLAACGSGEQQEVQHEPSLHEFTPRVRSNRR